MSAMRTVTWRPGRGGVLDRLAGRRRGRDDRGAVAVTVAILLGSGVLLGFLALVVDVGQIYVERSELQSSADAAALAVARACSFEQDSCKTEAAVVDLAGGYADRNAADGATHVAHLCGKFDDFEIDCDPPVDNLTECLGTAPTDKPYVEVRVSTELPDGRFVLPPSFAQSMAGNSGYTGAAIGACARATWTVASEPLVVVAFTLSVCEFNAATSDGYGSATSPSKFDEYEITFGAGPYARSCTTGAPPWTDPNRAGLLTTDSSCEVTIPPDGIVPGDYAYFGRDDVISTVDCETRLRQARANREVVYLAIHNGTDTVGGVTVFRTTSVVPFLVTGFSFGPPPKSKSPHNEPSIFPPGQVPCSGSADRCISGLFVGPPIPVTGIVEERSARLIG